MHAGAALPGWDALAGVRDEVGLRGPVHSAEKLVDWFGARRFVVGHTHGPYAERLVGALDALGADRAVAVRGIEGSDIMRPGRPSAAYGAARSSCPSCSARAARRRRPADAAWLTRAIVRGGEADDRSPHGVALSAGVRLYAGGPRAELARARRGARGASDGRAAKTLEALLAA